MKQIINNTGNKSVKRTMKWLLCAAFFTLHSSLPVRTATSQGQPACLSTVPMYRR